MPTLDLPFLSTVPDVRPPMPELYPVQLGPDAIYFRRIIEKNPKAVRKHYKNVLGSPAALGAGGNAQCLRMCFGDRHGGMQLGEASGAGGASGARSGWVLVFGATVEWLPERA
jgi:hypothetical protein